jgi:hypothetical protein
MIEEKNQKIEFTCLLKDPTNENQGHTYNIEYDPNGMKNLIIAQGQEIVTLPLDLFVETVDFLKSKGVIKGQTYGAPMKRDPHTELNNSPLPIPKIENNEEGDSGEKDNTLNFSSDIDPLSSFDISTTTNPVVDTQKKEEVEEEIKIEKEKPKEEIIKRTVIRSRVQGDDPLSAEKEAALIRGASSKSDKSVIKSRHREE